MGEVSVSFLREHFKAMIRALSARDEEENSHGGEFTVTSRGKPVAHILSPRCHDVYLEALSRPLPGPLAELRRVQGTIWQLIQFWEDAQLQKNLTRGGGQLLYFRKHGGVFCERGHECVPVASLDTGGRCSTCDDAIPVEGVMMSQARRDKYGMTILRNLEYDLIQQIGEPYPRVPGYMEDWRDKTYEEQEQELKDFIEEYA